MRRSRYVPLFWRLLVPNATVLGVACLVLFLEPADGRLPALAGGLIAMVAVNAVLIRRAVSPLTRLTRLMGDVDPLVPGRRLPPPSQQSEVAVLATAFNEMLERLEQERRDSGRRALAEREGERRRIAAELHDQIGQVLTAVALQLDHLAGRAPAELRHDVRDARDGVLTTVDDVRRLAQQLRPETLDTLGLVASLNGLAARIARRTQIEIVPHLDATLPPLDEHAELVLYRVAQEGMTNAVRHAGAHRIDLVLGRENGHVVLSVADDGRGIPGDHAERGIRGLRERAITLGAELAVGPRPGGGTELRLELPLEEAEPR